MFEKTLKIEKKIENFNEVLTTVRKKLAQYEEEIEKPFDKIKNDFSEQVKDFFNEKRKLRIGVIGQVKAGKSTFLNALLFEGKEVLPKAATPKTASLTVITHAPENKLKVHFYGEKEWEILQERALSEDESDEVKVAKEVTAMARENGIDVEKYIRKKTLEKKYSSYEELLGELNEYAGENGKLTPVVKYLELFVNDKNLDGLEIVDTPGMNDPIVSRTDQTREFIKKCDVVFFLSRASAFLDKNDMELLTRQMPQQGVAKLVLVGSQFDSAVNDEIWNVDSLEEAIESTRNELENRAKSEFEKLIIRYEEREVNENIISVLKGCERPVLISSMTYNMSKKKTSDFTEEERNVFANLSEHNEITPEQLAEIGNFGELKNIFADVIRKKDETIADKSASLIPSVVERTKSELNSLKTKYERRIELLEKNDISSLKKSKEEISRRINGISASLEEKFGELNIKFQRAGKKALDDLTSEIREYSEVTERTGTEERTGYREVSASKWWNPFSWGSTKLVSYTYTATYNYIDISDVVENIRAFTNEAVRIIQDEMNEALDVIKVKKQLLNTIVENFDMTDDDFDPNFYKFAIERVLNKFEIPETTIDAQSEIEEIVENFSGEVKSGEEKASLRLKLSNALASLFKRIREQVKKEIKNTTEVIDKAKEELAENLLKEINAELDIVMNQFQNREKELKKMHELVSVFQELIAGVKKQK